MSASGNPLPPNEVWASGEGYESYVGRWSRRVACEFITALAAPSGGRWLDVGCGTGALTQAILEIAAPQSTLGIDASQGFIAFARYQMSDARASFQVGDAAALDVETGAYDAVVSGLALNFFPRPEIALAEMARAARPGGLVSIYVWDYAGRMQFMRHFWNAAAELNPDSVTLDEGRRFPLCNPGPLLHLFQDAGLQEVVVWPVDIWTEFKDFDDFWMPFLSAQGPAPGYTMSLDEVDRTALRERLRAALPFSLDGSLSLMARAWAVRGVR